MMEPEDHPDVAAAHVCADLLDQRWIVHSVSLVLTSSAVLAVLLQLTMDNVSTTGLIFALVILSLGIVETLLATRSGFDAALLRRFAAEEPGGTMDLALLDSTLSRLELLPAAKTGRSLDTRLKGCLRLFRGQVIACAGQFIVVLIGGAWLAINL